VRRTCSFSLDQHVEDLAFGVDGSPQVDHAAVDFQIDFVQMRVRVGLGSAFAQVRCYYRPKMVHPAPNGFIADRDAAFRQQIFDVAEAQGEPEIEPDRLMDDLRWEPISTVADFLHSLGYLPARAAASPRRRDNAINGADAHRFKCRVIKFTSVVFFHAAFESHKILRVKKKCNYL
jgi:hypothetical protein